MPSATNESNTTKLETAHSLTPLLGGFLQQIVYEDDDRNSERVRLAISEGWLEPTGEWQTFVRSDDGSKETTRPYGLMPDGRIAVAGSILAEGDAE